MQSELSCINSIEHDSWNEKENSPVKLDQHVTNDILFKNLTRKTQKGSYEIQRNQNVSSLHLSESGELIEFIKIYRKCCHPIENQRMIISHIVLSEQSGILVDSTNNLWSFNCDELTESNQMTTSYLCSFPNCTFLKIVAGRNHFLVFLKRDGSKNNKSTSKNENQLSKNFDICPICQSDEETMRRISEVYVESDKISESLSATSGEENNQQLRSHNQMHHMNELQEHLMRKHCLNSLSEDVLMDNPWDIVNYKDRSYSQSNPHELDFSFVSLDRISIWDQIYLANEFSNIEEEETDSKQECNRICSLEVWSFGDNKCGQLGLSDIIDRSIPNKITALQGNFIIDVVAGSDFSAVLTAAGEVYIWGKNISSNGDEAILEPKRQKLGLNQFAFDITVTNDALWILLNGPGATVTLYRIGELLGGNTTTRVKLIKDQIPIKISGTETKVHMLKLLPHERLKNLLSIHFESSQMTKLIKGILDILNRLKEDISVLCENCQMLLSFYQEFSIVIQYTRTLIQSSTTDHDALDVFGKYSSKEFMKNLENALKACAVSLASGQLHSYAYPADLKLHIDRLATEYNEDSTQPAKVLVKLFFRIINWLKYLETFGQQLALLPKDDSARSTLNESIQIWHRSSTFLKRLMRLADKTLTLWNDPILNRVHHIGRFVLGSYNIGFKDEIKKVIVEKPRYRLMNPKISNIYVFSDLLVLIINGEARHYDLNLVWTSKTSDNIVTVKSPDMECCIEFNMENQVEDKTLSSFLMQCRYPFDPLMEGGPYPATRRGKHQFSADCEREKLRLAVYDGEWRNNSLHGKGTLLLPNGDIQKGMFVQDVLHGFGEVHKSVVEELEGTSGMLSSFYTTIPSKTEKFNISRGVFSKGILNGIAKLRYSDGRTYEGYVINNEPHGFGILRSSFEIHVGSFKNGIEFGYGVKANPKIKVLGEFGNCKERLNRLIVTIDGAVTEGELQNNIFKNGNIMAVMSDGETIEYEGEMDGSSIGKIGRLILSRNRCLRGSFGGNLLSGNVQILDGTLEFLPCRDNLMNEEPVLSQWAVPVERRWKEMFDVFMSEELGREEGKSTSCEQVWSSIVWAMERGRQLLCRNPGGQNEKYTTMKGFSTALEHIPDYNSEWGLDYYNMIVEYWNLALENVYHPLNRILMSIVDVFQISYGDVAEHRALYAHATFEAIHLINKMYDIVRILFPTLPEDPNHVISNDFLDMNDLTNNISFSTYDDEIDSSPQKNLSNKFRFPVPACDFINEVFFSRCGPVLFSIFSLYNKEINDRYWERTMYLNNFPDSKILKYLSVPNELWPPNQNQQVNCDCECETQETISTCSNFYHVPVHMLQRLPMETNPSQKLRIIADTFSAMKSEVAKLHKTENLWNTDILLPAFTYVVVRAQIRHLGTEILLIDNFSRIFRGSGEVSMMFTMLQSSYHIIFNDKNTI